VNLRPDGSHLMAWGSSGNLFMSDSNNDVAGFLQMDKALAVGQVTEIATLP